MPLVEFGDHQIKLSNLDKVLWPGVPFTKAQLIDYYLRVAPAILPHLVDRPVTLIRYPDGVTSDGFFQKNLPDFAPTWLQTCEVELPRGKAPLRQLLIARREDLVWMANSAAIEVHSLLWRCAGPDSPDLVVFDLDPGEGAGVRECAVVALMIRDLLSNFELDCVAKTSGSKGLQVYAPIGPAGGFNRSKGFAKAVAMLLERREPTLVVSTMTKALRVGKVFIDWSQNDPMKTTVSVYSVRAAKTPTVSTPLRWSEVQGCADGDSELVFLTDDVLRRVEEFGDLFANVSHPGPELPELKVT